MIDLSHPDSFLIARIIGVRIRSDGSVSLDRSAEQIPIGSLRSGERVAVTVSRLVGAVTETGGHEVVVTILAIDDAGSGSLSLGEIT